MVVSRLYADPANRAKLRALAGLGCSVAALVPATWPPGSDPHGWRTSFGEDGGVQIIPVPVSGTPEGELRWDPLLLRRALAGFRPELVQVEEEPWTRLARALVRWAPHYRYRVCLFSRESVARRLSPAARLRARRALRCAHGVAGGNRLAEKLLSRRRPDVPRAVLPQIGVVPPTAVRRQPHTGFSMGCIGRLVPAKGLDVLFRAALRVAEPWSIQIVGTGPAQEELERLAGRLGIASRITWHGALPRSALDQLWPALDCLVVPSRSTPTWVEIEARTVLAGMAHGLPVVASECGALPEVVGPAGHVVPEGDVDGLAAALASLEASPDQRRLLGAQARRRVLAEYSNPALAARTLAFWQAVMAGATS